MSSPVQQAVQQAQLARGRMIETRFDGIGGSDVHHVFSLAPYGCARQLAYEKQGHQPDHPFHGNRATERGTRLEDFAAEVYTEETGRQIRRVAGGLKGEPKRDPQYPFMLCHADREIVNDPRGPGMLSIKAPGREMFQKVKFEGTPHSWSLQLQYEMAIFDRNWGDAAIFWPDGWQMLPSCDVERDGALIREVREGVRQFWEDYIVPSFSDDDAPLPPRLEPKDPRCGRCPFRTTCQGQALVALMEKPKEVGLEIPYDPSLAELVQLRAEHKEIFEQAEALLEQTNAKIKAAMGDRLVCDTDGARIYHSVVRGRKTFQAEPFAKAYTQLYPEEAAEFTELASKFTNTGAPSRRLSVYPK